MAIRDEMSRIPMLRYVGCALVDLVEDLAPGTVWLRHGRRWIPTPDRNFVTFTIQSARAKTIALSLRGHTEEFPGGLQAVLSLKAGRGNGAYSDCSIRSAKQLAAAAWYVYVAYEIFRRGGSRIRRRVHLRET